jgi:GST-like protein
MIDLYYWPTPNGWKISIALEEMELPYELRLVNIGRGEQFESDFLGISPNNRMPAIVDHDPIGGGGPLSLFESGAILLYLAEKTGKFMPTDMRGRYGVMQWLMWQMGGLGPMGGQAGHFRLYAQGDHEYSVRRYTDEVDRLYGVLDRQLAGAEYICGEFSIADMACWPWIVPHRGHGQQIESFEHLKRWYDRMKERPGVQRGFDVAKEIRRAKGGVPDEKARSVLFGQRARR